ncbi:MAG: 3-phenylpropionate/trans-cinnamate dioxygenase ferredoxin reductase component [Gaiellaceae bacterium]|nr:3-phenylpropionate/trans-cinnamate dioxygenase ferredoxin reductase component [Gaiellaceae bacterium]
MSVERIVIVGSGGAGTKAAESLRQRGYDGSLTLVTADPHPPYARPPLSKVYLRGELELEKFFLALPDDLDLRLSTTVAEISAGEVVLDSGERLPFDRLLLATGSEPRRLPGTELTGIHYLRNVGDSDAIREHAQDSKRAVVIGAGFIGSEVAASLRQLGLEVTLVEGGRLPLEHVFGPEIGTFYRDLHVAEGVEVLTSAKLAGFEGNGSVQAARLDDGTLLEADLVVVGIGVAPRIQLAEAAGIEVENGVLVDERLETSVPGIFAAGDIALAQHPFYQARLRVEHWFTAANMGPVAAANMLGGDEPYDRIPYFYSDQFDTKMEYSGFAPRWDEVVLRGDPASRSFMAFWLEDDRVIAGMSVNVADTTEAVEALIRGRESVDRARLSDPDTPL